MGLPRHAADKVFAGALEVAPAERKSFLDRACGGDHQLRQLVEALLSEEERAGSFLQMPAIGNAPGAAAATVSYLHHSIASRKAPDAARFRTGDTIAQRFHVVRFIARGGMGEVYEVEDSLLQGNRVALKMILPEIAADEDSSHRFEQEVLLARKVNHPNLCPIYELFRCEATPPPFLFLTMKLLAGETLESSLRKNLLLPAGEIREIFRQIISGIAAIHQAGIVHRDIKPTNVMLDRYGPQLLVSIMDFGLARRYEGRSTVTQAGAIAGTPGYLAPELLRGHRPSRASDIFALGVLLHEVMTGEKPAESADGLKMLSASPLDATPLPATYAQTVRDFLSDEALVRCRAFEKFRASMEGSVSLQVKPQHSSQLWTRRHMLIASGAASCAIAGGVFWNRDRIADYLEPLPAKRFVALLGWPPSADVKIKSILIGLIDSVSAELARAEAYDHDLFLIPHFSSDVITPAQLNDVREALGANLILAASAIRSSQALQVSLQVLSPLSPHALRTKRIHVGQGEELTLTQKAVHAAAALLGIHDYEPSEQRLAAGTSNPDAYSTFQAAEALRKQSNDVGLEAAIEKYKEAITIDGHYAIATANLALAYCRLADLKHDPAATVLARANAEKALSLDPSLTSAHLALAGALEQTGDEISALREMKKALAADPVNPETLIWLGQAYSRLNRWQSAEDTFLRVLQLRPNNWIAHNEFGVVLYLQGKYLRALSEFRTAALASPKDVMTQSNVGFMYLVLGRIPEALAKFKISLSMQRTALALSMMSAALRSQRDAHAALPFAEEATRLEAGNSGMWLELGDCESLIHGHERQAREAYVRAASVQREALANNGTSGRDWILLGLYEAKLGAIEDALLHLHKGESLPSNDLDTELCKARLLETIGQRDAALAQLKSCLERGATTVQVNLMPEMTQLKEDPRYRAILGMRPDLRMS